MGAGSTIFAKSILGDSLLVPALRESEIALYDIDAGRLEESRMMLENLNANVNEGRARISAHLGVESRKDALRGAKFVVNAVQVGGYEPATVLDFEIPKKYGLGQTIADTLGIGGIMRALRTIPVVLDFARDMEEVCPEALLLTYVNPMAMVTAAVLRATSVRAVGLCHSVPGLAKGLLRQFGMLESVRELRWKVAGINHQAWLLEVTDSGRDLYPEVMRRAREARERIMAAGGARAVVDAAQADWFERGRRWWDEQCDAVVARNLVRVEMMLRLGYYMTEGSLHAAEYVPWFIKKGHPELLDRYNITLDEYMRRCVSQIAGWRKQRDEVVNNKRLEHKRTGEYGSYIMDAVETDVPFRIHGNVMNDGLVTNLPAKACVEVPCMVDRNGVNPCKVGDLPEVCAAVNRTNVNVQLLTVEAALTGRRELIYQAAMLDPHAAAELTIDEIVSMVDELIAAHGPYLPEYR